MTTPRGAVHRDVEQRLRDMEAALQVLTGAALRRGQLSVTQGDFPVSGGGSIVVQDGGNVELRGKGGELRQVTADGRLIYRLADLEAAYGETPEQGMSLLVSKDGTDALATLALNTILPGDLYPNGYAAFQYGGDQFYVSAPDILLGQAGGITAVVGYLQAPNLPTTGQGANVNWNSNNGNLRVVTSTERHKYDLRDLDTDPRELVALTPCWYKRRDEADEDDPRTYAGTSAEQAHELGLTAWVSYDAEGQPWSFDYANWTMALQAIVRWLAERADAAERRLEQLESEVSAQAGTIADLTARLERLEAKQD